MTDHNTLFLTFDEAVKIARSEPGVELIGINFVEPFMHLSLYLVSVDPDEPESVNIAYEGGTLFSSGGEEDFYDLSDVPADAKNLFYARMSDLADGNIQVMGMTSEFVLQAVLPGLSQDAKYRNHADFRKIAGAEFRAYWRHL